MAVLIDFEEELRRMQERVKNVMDTFLRTPMFIPQMATESWVPDMDVFETEEEICIMVDVAGLNKEDINITLEGDMLYIRGQRRNFSTSDPKKYHQIELRYGPFARTYRLPCSIEEDKVTASYRNGILEIRLPKKKPVVRILKSEGE